MPGLMIAIALVLLGVAIMMFSAQNRQQKEEEKIISNFRNFYLKYGVPMSALNRGGFLPRAECINGGGILKSEYLYGCWKTNDGIQFLCYELDSCIKFTTEEIVCFNSIGDEHYYTEVSGGGGGGSSLTGAIIGGALAGSTGAIIGSRKGNAPVTTTVNHVNNKQTMLKVVKNGEERTLVFDDAITYNQLISFVPNKEISVVSQSNVSSNSNKDDFVATLNKLKTLHDNGVITDEEYNKKRQELIDGI